MSNSIITSKSSPIRRALNTYFIFFYCNSYILGQVCLEGYFFACYRVGEFYCSAVERLTVDIFPLAAVKVVAYKRMTETAHMTAYLVRLACLEVEA